MSDTKNNLFEATNVHKVAGRNPDAAAGPGVPLQVRVRQTPLRQGPDDGRPGRSRPLTEATARHGMSEWA